MTILFPIPLWDTWFCQSLGVPVPALLENPRQCPCRQLSFDHYGDHIQKCQRQSTSLPAHEWIVYRLSLLLRSVGHRVKTHRITPAADNERGASRSRIMSSYHTEKILMTDKDVPLSIQTERSHTEYPPPVLLSLMVPSTRQPE
jgi:hypothetical protein